ncbi:acyl-CoA N-acyltransferase [Suillus subalutaceus]|uniref:acyl-CoA N-acyltransferase n=1 Tax=Suillus subalutaceus TaxID=48586 RepID=UPI001B880749|nr:acyl-CoA N-acyltransferase [Suillus subalutaceus]KAG1841430.1 acyl-CoA N-acyltransferase [Suillus subalutaceus]
MSMIDTMSTTHVDPASLDLMFPQELISLEVSAQLPSDLQIRPLASTDYKRGYLDVLSVLTVVNDLGEEVWVNQFHAMRATPSAHFSIVVLDKASDKIVGIGTVFIHCKFLLGFGSVGHIEDIAVAKSHQRKKLGFLIVQALTHISESSGCYKTRLGCIDTTMPFYQKCGYAKMANEMVKYSPEHVNHASMKL